MRTKTTDTTDGDLRALLMPSRQNTHEKSQNFVRNNSYIKRKFKLFSDEEEKKRDLKNISISILVIVY
jgi:hypothetical protein